MVVDYATVTEKTGNAVTRDQLCRMCNRYYFAAPFCQDRDVLEVACGSGQGLGHLARKARSVVGGDYAYSLVQLAQAHYQGRVPLIRLDAQTLPFDRHRFDVVLLYEAMYYLAAPDQFLTACRRVLRPGGVLLIATANKDWPGCARSPFSTRYYGAPELDAVLKRHGFDAELLADFPVSAPGINGRIVGLIRSMAVTLNLMPKTMKGKELFKRVFYGRLLPLPSEIEDGMVEVSRPVPVPSHIPVTMYKVLYAVARV